jgi:hypothetical protein
MLKVKVHNSEVRTVKGENAKGPWQRRVQDNCFVEMPDGEVRKIPISITNDQFPYPAGNYQLNGESLLTVGQYGFEIKKFVHIELLPIVDKPVFKTAS